MRLRSPEKKHAPENIIPMINIVFLLLIFFMISASFTAPEPFDVSPPVADTRTSSQTSSTVFISATGELAFQNARGEQIYEAVSLALSKNLIESIQIRADMQTEARLVSRIIARLHTEGVQKIALVTVPKS